MIHKTEAIVFRTFPLRDSRYILKAFTKDFGLKSFVIRSSKKSKSNALAKAQSLNLICLEWIEKGNSEFSYVRSMELAYPFNNFYLNIEKSSIALFLAEVLYKSIKEEVKNEALFAFLKNSLIYLDAAEQYANFHLSFLIKLSKFHGYLPLLDQGMKGNYFDVQDGLLAIAEPKHEYYFSKENSNLLRLFSGTNFDECESIKLNREKRNVFLNDVLNYYRFHVEGMEEIKGHEVLQAVFG